MDIFIIIFTVLMLISVFIYIWWFGHKSSWGKLAILYPVETSLLDFSFKNKKKESVSLRVDHKWDNSWNAVSIFLTESGCYLIPESCFKWLVPAICIPWNKISEIKESKLFFSKKVELIILEVNINLLLPGRYFSQCEMHIKNIKTV